MCGIFGYVGTDEASAVRALRGLRDLEYRGYDSWGIATQTPDCISIQKAIGKISDAKESDFDTTRGSLSIGHSRWATHGKVTTRNAHPHTNADESIVVVHNGIIENAEALRTKLSKYKFLSQTDTEVIPHLIDYYRGKGHSMDKVIQKVAGELEGRYAFLVIEKGDDTLYGARSGSPLIIGKGTDGAYYIASDVPAFLDDTNVVNYLDDGEYVKLAHKKASFHDLSTGKVKKKRNVKIEWSKEQSEKGDFEHFMLKEILEQKEALMRSAEQDPKELARIARLIKKSKRVLFTGSGTAGHACMTGRYFFNVIGNKQVSYVTPSEFSLYEKFMDKDTLLIVVSQSGETADVLEAMERAKAKGAPILSIVNVRGSSIDRMSDYSLYIKAGPEIAVASTKATTAQLAVLFQIAYALADDLPRGEQLVRDTAGLISDWLNPRYLAHIRRVAKKIEKNEHIYCIGRSYHVPIAMEAALKIQEISYIHAEGFPGGEIKHGPIALISKGTPVLAFVGEDETKQDMLSNIEELRARGALIVAIAAENHKSFDHWISVPKGEHIAPIVSLIPAQILSYYLAILRGNNPDKPRNLAKSVTVK